MYKTFVKDICIDLCYNISMGHREDLLKGAKRCLAERGYARTTARDIVAASGTNLASIGYHFGSKDALLNAAMFEAIEEWSVSLEQLLAASSSANDDPLVRFELIWTKITESMEQQRWLWQASFEAGMQAEHQPEIRTFLANSIDHARSELAKLFLPSNDHANPATQRALGSLYLALLEGLMVQWLIDPQRAPTGHDLTIALRAILQSYQLPGADSSNTQ